MNMDKGRGANIDKASFWKKNSKTVPGRPSPKKEVKPAVKTKPAGTTSFQDFQASVSDAWDLEDDEFYIGSSEVPPRISKKVSQSAALNVINSHRNAEASTKQSNERDGEIVRIGSIPGRPQLLPRANLDCGDDCEKRCEKFDALMAGSPTHSELCDLSWSGIPYKLRPKVWKLLLGYLPMNTERRDDVLERKRQDYWTKVKQHYESERDQYQDTYHQIHIDVPRMNPSVPLFQLTTVQQMFERVLFVWAVRHPASGYVQGINDLVTPFFVVFLQEAIPDSTPFETFDINTLTPLQRDIIEADSFWCLSKFLDGIQNNYVFAQVGIQEKANQLKDLIKRVDAALHNHLVKHNVDYLQFSFRWLNNLLTRELPLRCTIHLWDTYLSECASFAQFQLYVCAAFLLRWKEQLLDEQDFQGLMILLQNLPTREWTGFHIRLLLAEAYKLKVHFADAPNHLNTHQTPTS